MSDLLKTGAAWLAGSLKGFASSSVVYVRGEDRVTLSATIGRTEFDHTDARGNFVRVVSRDFLISGADLVLAGEAVEPERGDLIEETQGGKVYVYDVLAPGDEPPWRWSDPWREMYRIHTKQVDVRDAE